MLGSDEMREIYQRTEIIRRPTYGIITGYHELPYVCLGSREDATNGTTRIKGRIHVSPRFVIRPPWHEPSYEDIFGDDNVDQALAGRVFGFLGLRGRPVECTSEHLEIKHLEGTIDKALAGTLDELERMEDITTGVIVTPSSRYYPVSLERFIASILDDEFRA
ncbi:MAG: hypothetical protein K1Y02_14035 [Candidatus Hydrogenedentes bacterium]|nr:hypothetical protein [Candidatus Hydrogenedentota bacterium]